MTKILLNSCDHCRAIYLEAGDSCPWCKADAQETETNLWKQRYVGLRAELKARDLGGAKRRVAAWDALRQGFEPGTWQLMIDKLAELHDIPTCLGLYSDGCDPHCVAADRRLIKTAGNVVALTEITKAKGVQLSTKLQAEADGYLADYCPQDGPSIGMSEEEFEEEFDPTYMRVKLQSMLEAAKAEGTGNG